MRSTTANPCYVFVLYPGLRLILQSLAFAEASVGYKNSPIRKPARQVEEKSPFMS